MSSVKKNQRKKNTKVLDLELEKRKDEELGENLGTEEWNEEEREIGGEETED